MEQFLHVTVNQGEAVIQPNGMMDDRHREAVASVTADWPTLTQLRPQNRRRRSDLDRRQVSLVDLPPHRVVTDVQQPAVAGKVDNACGLWVAISPSPFEINRKSREVGGDGS